MWGGRIDRMRRLKSGFALLALAVSLISCDGKPANELSVTKHQDQAKEAARKIEKRSQESVDLQNEEAAGGAEPQPAPSPAVEP